MKQPTKLYAFLSQIGKFFIPHEILTKESRLSDEEFEIMKTHITHTLETVRRLELSENVYKALSHMHERLDGSGYPNSLGEGEISELGQVLAVADVFAARTSARGYRTAISIDEAMQILADHTDKYALPVVDALSIYVTTNPDKATGQS